jgi:hypothetical protein
MPPAKRQQTKSNADPRPATVVVSGIPTNMSQPLSSADPKDGFRTPSTPSGPVFADYPHDWDGDVHAKEPHYLNLNLGESMNALPLVSQLLELQNHSSNSVSTVGPNANDSVLNSLAMTPPMTVNPTATSPSLDLSEYRSRRCECVRSLADSLEKINGDGGSNIDIAKGFDELLLYSREGIKRASGSCRAKPAMSAPRTRCLSSLSSSNS